MLAPAVALHEQCPGGARHRPRRCGHIIVWLAFLSWPRGGAASWCGVGRKLDYSAISRISRIPAILVPVRGGPPVATSAISAVR